MKFKVLTYNILFGMKGDNLFSNVVSHFCLHGARALLPEFIAKNTAIFLSKLRSRHLNQVISIIKEENPDIICLNELLRGMHKQILEKELKLLGYKTFVWGSSLHHESPIDVSTVLISKFDAKELGNNITFLPKMGGGGGCATMLIEKLNLLVMGIHTSSLDSSLSKRQMKEVFDYLIKSKKNFKILLMGDFNKTSDELKCECPVLFKEFDFNIEQKTPTCPFFYVPRIKPKRLDQIFFLNNEFKLIEEKLIESVSDHKVVVNILKKKK